jgi:F-type H+-transporting ATPase subunit delta
MTSNAVITRYANALVDVLLGPNAGMQHADAIGQLRSFEAALHGTSALRTVLASPAVPKARKRTIVRRISEALGLSRVITNFLLVLTDHGRAGALTETIQSFELLLDERLGFVHADVRSAFELTPAQQEALSRELERLAGKQVRTRFAADPDLIGGVTARLGSKLYDGSVRGRLAKMRNTLAA